MIKVSTVFVVFGMANDVFYPMALFTNRAEADDFHAKNKNAKCKSFTVIERSRAELIEDLDAKILKSLGLRL